MRLADGEELSARHILVAVGSRPTLLPGVEGLEHAITSNEIFDLPSFRERLLVVGGGYIAVEFASLFQRLGSEVTQVMRAPNVLRGFDDDMREGVRDGDGARRRHPSVRLPAEPHREGGPRASRRAHRWNGDRSSTRR